MFLHTGLNHLCSLCLVSVVLLHFCIAAVPFQAEFLLREANKELWLDFSTALSSFSLNKAGNITGLQKNGLYLVPPNYLEIKKTLLPVSALICGNIIKVGSNTSHFMPFCADIWQMFAERLLNESAGICVYTPLLSPSLSWSQVCMSLSLVVPVGKSGYIRQGTHSTASHFREAMLKPALSPEGNHDNLQSNKLCYMKMADALRIYHLSVVFVCKNQWNEDELDIWFVCM